MGSVVAHRLSCPVACGIFLDQRSNPCSLHWQADSLPLCHQENPVFSLSSFAAQKFSILMKSNWSIFSFVICVFHIITKNILPNPRPDLFLISVSHQEPSSCRLINQSESLMSPWTCSFLCLANLFFSFQIQLKYHLSEFCVRKECCFFKYPPPSGTDPVFVFTWCVNLSVSFSPFKVMVLWA